MKRLKIDQIQVVTVEDASVCIGINHRHKCFAKVDCIDE